jgi:alpha-1,3-rhamnosyl/mannosyltransferase
MIEPTDAAQLALLLERLADDPKHREGRARACQERASQFSWQRCAEQTLDVYRRVLAES